MKSALYFITIIIVIFMALVLFNWMCLSDVAQAQADPTPTAEVRLTHSFGRFGVPIIPARDVTVLGAIDYYALEGDPLYVGHDIVERTVYQRYVLGGVCFVLAYHLDIEAQLGDDGYPHPSMAYHVECD